MINIKLQYGIETHHASVPDGATIGSVVRNATNKVILGYGDNIKALVGGVEQPEDAHLFDGAHIVLETRANSKATK